MSYKITLTPASDLRPYEANARTHPRSQLEQIKAMIRLVGFTNPILVDNAGIIAGHGRHLAALELYEAGETIYGPGRKFALPAGTVPTIDASGMSDTERRAYVLADNQIAANAGWDHRLVDMEIKLLQSADFDLPLLGFSDGELMSFALDREEGETDTRREWQGMPDFDNPDNCHRKIIVSFGAPEDVAAFAKALGVDLTAKTKSLWYPPKPVRNHEAQRWSAGDE